MSNRTLTTGFPWTTESTPDVPGTPVDGTSYRNSAITQALLAAGWPFDKVANSSTMNEILYRLTTLMLLIEAEGIMPWSTLTGYLPGAVVMGSNGMIYTGISGTLEAPNQGNDPTTDTGTNWFLGINWTAVQQGGGVNQTNDKLYMGWDSTGTNHVRVTRNSTDWNDLAWLSDLTRYSVDTGTVNAYVGAFAPGLSGLTDGLTVILKIAHTNTGPSTLTADGQPQKSIVGFAGASLQGGELFATGNAVFKYNTSMNSGAGAWVLLGCEGGSLQVGDTTASKQAINQESGDARYAALAGSLSQQFKVADATTAHQAVALEQLPANYSFDESSPPVTPISLNIRDRLTISFEAVSSIPLHLASVPGVYTMKMIVTASTTTNFDLAFLPNDTTYSGAFSGCIIEAQDTGASSPTYVSGSPVVDPYVSGWNFFYFDLFGGPVSPDSINDIGPAIIEFLISTYTTAKMIKESGGIHGGPSISFSKWQDTTTPWASLGTLEFSTSGTLTGVLIIERLA